MAKIISVAHNWVWGAPALLLMIGTGLYLTVLLDFLQLRKLPESIRFFLKKLRPPSKEGVSPIQALCTALAATVGTGNVVGVAGAICLGGPGAVFWMWVCGILGMATKYAEVTLALRYRVRRGNNAVGGPMYMMERGLHFPWLGRLYALLGLLACFGVGNWAQVNTVISGVAARKGSVNPWLLGLSLALLTGIALLGGIQRIGRTAERLVPGAAAAYLLLCIFVLILHWPNLGCAVRSIFVGAFSPRAATGGFLGASALPLRMGCSRGIFSNEAGMGTASIAHASAEGTAPEEQGLLGIVEVFLDTMVICTMTALVILSSGVRIPYGKDVGAVLTEQAFKTSLGEWSSFALTGCMSCFAFATILGWSVYGAACAGYLFGQRAIKPFYILQSVMVVFGGVIHTDTVWLLCETLNGAMAIPNLIALAVLSPQLKQARIGVS